MNHATAQDARPKASPESCSLLSRAPTTPQVESRRGVPAASASAGQSRQPLPVRGRGKMPRLHAPSTPQVESRRGFQPRRRALGLVRQPLPLRTRRGRSVYLRSPTTAQNYTRTQTAQITHLHYPRQSRLKRTRPCFQASYNENVVCPFQKESLVLNPELRRRVDDVVVRLTNLRDSL